MINLETLSVPVPLTTAGPTTHSINFMFHECRKSYIPRKHWIIFSFPTTTYYFEISHLNCIEDTAYKKNFMADAVEHVPISRLTESKMSRPLPSSSTPYPSSHSHLRPNLSMICKIWKASWRDSEQDLEGFMATTTGLGLIIFMDRSRERIEQDPQNLDGLMVTGTARSGGLNGYDAVRSTATTVG